MIIDNIQNASLYFGMSERIKAALQYLQQNDFDNMDVGTYEIDGLNIYTMIQKYKGKPIEKGVWEAHKKYIDLQYIYKGTEKLGYAFTEDLTVKVHYEEDRDRAYLEGNGSFLLAKQGTFAVFFPEDAHMPCLIADDPNENIVKIVVKIAV